MNQLRKISLGTAVSIVIANMVGTGVFTSLGFQVIGIQTVFAVLMLWVFGGVMALCGALAYGELGAAFPQNGGDYNYLSKIYHPFIGFLSGWVSAIIGFAAPVAAAAMALGSYVHGVFPVVNTLFIALAVVISLTILHATNLKLGARFQRYATIVKVAFIVLFIISGLLSKPVHAISILPNAGSWKDIFQNNAFVVGLYWISYAYNGWNASSYVAGEMKNPYQNIPRSLFVGTIIVTVLYVMLNFVFLYTTPVAELQGQLEVGHLSAKHIFGIHFGNVMGMMIALLLVSTISAMILAGPRVSAKIGEEFPMLHLLSKRSENGVPFVAVFFQSLISIVLIITNQFSLVIDLIGFTLTIFTTLTVLGVFVLRIKKPDLPRPYKTWGYPVTPILFLAINSWILYYGFTLKIRSSLYGLLIVVVGALVWLVVFYRKKRAQHRY